jgi:hypothetical protein
VVYGPDNEGIHFRTTPDFAFGPKTVPSGCVIFMMEWTVDVQRIAAFSQGVNGGNPAGVVLCDALPPAGRMLAIAAEVGYSETVFAAPNEVGWRVRYFAPEIEVPFCGHATIALGAALALAQGDGTFTLQLNDAQITVTGWRDSALMAALQSTVDTRGGSRMRESRSYGSGRGARGNSRPYRETEYVAHAQRTGAERVG